MSFSKEDISEIVRSPHFKRMLLNLMHSTYGFSNEEKKLEFTRRDGFYNSTVIDYLEKIRCGSETEFPLSSPLLEIEELEKYKEDYGGHHRVIIKNKGEPMHYISELELQMHPVYDEYDQSHYKCAITTFDPRREDRIKCI